MISPVRERGEPGILPRPAAKSPSRGLLDLFLRRFRQASSSPFVRSVAETWLTKILLMAIGMVTSILVTRTLGPEGRGLYASAAAVAAIGVQFGTLGLQSSNTFYVSREPHTLPVLVANSLIVSLVCGGAVSGLLWVLTLVSPDTLTLRGSLLALTLIGIPIGIAYLLLQNLLLGTGETRPYNLIELAIRACTVAAIGTVLVARTVSATAILAIVLLAPLVGIVWALARLLRRAAETPIPSVTSFIQHVRYGLKAYVAGFGTYIVLKADLLVVNSLLGAEQAGYYAVASGLADLLYMLPTAVGAIIFPRLAALTDRKEQWRIAGRSVRGLTAMMAALTATAAMAAGPLIKTLYGPAFLPAAAPFRMLCGSMVFFGANTVVSCYLSAIGFPAFQVFAWVAVALLNIGLNLVVIPACGICGAAISSLVCYGVILLLLSSYARRTVAAR